MRTDGRKPKQLRALTIRPSYIKTADGSVLIEFGDTKVICTAKLEERVPPFLRNSGKGWITAEYGMLPGSSQSRIARESSRGKIGGRTHEIQRLIGRSLRAVADLPGRSPASGGPLGGLERAGRLDAAGRSRAAYRRQFHLPLELRLAAPALP